MGSARSKQEISRFVSLIHPLIDLTPLRFVQRLAASVPGDLTQMFSDSQGTFIRAMCRAIFDWDGLGDVPVDLLRIHGRQDKVIPLPKGIQHVLNGGHLLAMTHAQECVSIIATHHRVQSAL